jgi:hypothetical protein
MILTAFQRYFHSICIANASPEYLKLVSVMGWPRQSRISTHAPLIDAFEDGIAGRTPWGRTGKR